MKLWLARKLLGRRDPRVIWLPHGVDPRSERDRNTWVCLVAEWHVERAMQAWRDRERLRRYQYRPLASHFPLLRRLTQ